MNYPPFEQKLFSDKHLMHLLLMLCMTLLIPIEIHSQTTDEIKLNSNYYWGEGTAQSHKEARALALENIITNICVHVSSNSSLDIENNREGGKLNSSERFASRINTYSSMTLNNCHTIDLSSKSPYVVFLYIEKSEVEKMFKVREERVKEYVNIANESLADLNLADALRYYYSAYLYSQSLINPNAAKVEDEEGNERSAQLWIKKRIEDILSNIKPVVMGKNAGDEDVYRVGFFYKEKPVSRVGYTYWNGNYWTDRVEYAIDGQGLMELMSSVNPKNARIRVEYKFENLIQNDRELASVYDALAEDINFSAQGVRTHVQGATTASTTSPASGQSVKMASKAEQTSVSSVMRIKPEDKPLSEVEGKKYADVLSKVIQCITTKRYEGVQSLCTTEGYTAFKELIHYGSARVVGTPNVTFQAYNGHIYGRSVPMQFSFRGNNRFTENVVFTFTPEGKIDDVTFGLGKIAAENLYSNLMEDTLASVRSALNNFLESYKTAYALGRFDYLKMIFSDDALIVTGKQIRRLVGNKEHGYHEEKHTVKTRQTKDQYLRNLEAAFRNKEFVNIQFVNNYVQPSRRSIMNGRNVYGIQIRQDYFSNNYKDQGYLFLRVDVTDPDQPIVSVRVWQEMPDKEEGVANISNWQKFFEEYNY